MQYCQLPHANWAVLIKGLICLLQGAIGDSGLEMHQVFEKISSHDVIDDIDKRFEHLKSRIWPRIRDLGSADYPQALTG